MAEQKKIRRQAEGAKESAPDTVAGLRAALLPAMLEPPRVPQQARSREKRDDILNAAAAMFAERGYEATTADEIAAAAGVSVGTFYNYFHNKRQALLTLVIDRIEDIFSNLRLARMDFSHGNHRQVIYAAIESALDSGTQTGLRRVWLELMSHDPDLVPYQRTVERFVLTELEASLRHVTEAGLAWPNLDIEATAYAIFILLDSLSLRDGTDLDDGRLIESLTDMIHRTIFPPERPPVI